MNISTLSEPTQAVFYKGPWGATDCHLLQSICNISETHASIILADNYHSIAGLAKLSQAALAKYPGMSLNKASALILAFELGRRKLLEQTPSKVKVTCSQDVYEFMKPYLLDQQVEFFYVLMLSRSNQIIKLEMISQGGTCGTVVDSKILFKRGLECLAQSMILVHNHPSGNLRPSDQDKSLTTRLVKVGRELDMPILDHQIFTDLGYFSFADEGIL
jgi:DNA repair protein RadC